MFLRIWISLILFINDTIALFSFNQPRLRPNTIWISNATTFANQTIIGANPHGMFVDSKNSIYAANRQTGEIFIWQNKTSINPSKRISNKLSDPYSMFVIENVDIYVANANDGRIDKWIVENQTWISLMNVESHCVGLVIDLFNNLYCSIAGGNRVDRKARDGTIQTVAGTGVEGPELDKLTNPHGLFMEAYQITDLYVADYGNHRIQLFNIHKRNVTTVAGNGSLTITIELCFPSGIILDGIGYLFIVDSGNNRLIGSDEYGFRCIFGCSREGGSTNDKLLRPTSMFFDKYGSIYVIDGGNNRIQKIDENHCHVEGLVRTEYMSNLSTNSYKCDRIGTCKLLSYYCEIIEIHIREEGLYTITSNSANDLDGYLYENKNLTLFDLHINVIRSNDNGYCDNQFKFILNCSSNSSLILIVTTNRKLETGDFFVNVNGPSLVSMERISKFIIDKHLYDTKSTTIQSNYSSILTDKSQKHLHHYCTREEYYYEALEINVNISGYYMLSSENSSLNTFGALYAYQFDPYDSVDTSLTTNDKSCEDQQFKLTAYLQNNITYILIVTTSPYDKNMQGSFSVIVSGPDKIKIKQMDAFPTRTVVQSSYSSKLIINEATVVAHRVCPYLIAYQEPLQIDVVESGNYTLISIDGLSSADAYLYKQHFNPYSLSERLISDSREVKECRPAKFKIITQLESSMTYILIVRRYSTYRMTNSSIFIFGPNNITFSQINLRTTYKSELTNKTQVYSRVCGEGNYHYETIQVNVQQSGSYTFDSNTSMPIYGYIYRNNFDPSYPNENLLVQSNFSCSGLFHVGSYFEVNTVYILVVTTFDPNILGSFEIFVTGPSNVTLNRINKKHSTCVIGDHCNLYAKGIGLTINDILRTKIQSNTPFTKQSALVQTAAGITISMFVIGLVNGFLSLITFQNKELRKVGCGLYLLASSITSLLTITLFTIKFWFVALIQLYSITSSSILRTDCVFISPVLKLCLYLDSWLNGCVAIERTVNVSKGVQFDKNLSRRAARWIIAILFVIIMGTIIHEPIHHELFKYTTQKHKSKNYSSVIIMDRFIESEDKHEHHVLCVIRYSHSFQTYNTITLFIHLIAPFIANLYSALFIIFGTARRRSTVKVNKKTFEEHVINQMKEHKQLLISPFILLILATPRLIMSLISGCVDPSQNPWLYLSGYFISFTPSMLIFIVFVLPSELYRKTFKESMTRWRRRIRP